MRGRNVLKYFVYLMFKTLSGIFTRKQKACDLYHIDKNQMRKIDYEIEDLNTFCKTEKVEVFCDVELFEECGVYAYLDKTSVYPDKDIFLTRENAKFKFAGICKKSKTRDFFLKDKHVGKGIFFILLGTIKGVLFEKSWTNKTLSRILKNKKIVELDAIINNPIPQLTMDKINNTSLINPTITIYTDVVILKTLLNELIEKNALSINIDTLDKKQWKSWGEVKEYEYVGNRGIISKKIGEESQQQKSQGRPQLCGGMMGDGFFIESMWNRENNFFVVVCDDENYIVGVTFGRWNIKDVTKIGQITTGKKVETDDVDFKIGDSRVVPIINISLFCGTPGYKLVGRNMMNIFKQLVAQAYIHSMHNTSNVLTDIVLRDISPSYCIFLSSIMDTNTRIFYSNSDFIKLARKTNLNNPSFLEDYVWFLSLNRKYIEDLTTNSQISGIKKVEGTAHYMDNTLTIIPQKDASPETPLGIKPFSNQFIRSNSITSLEDLQKRGFNKSVIEDAKETRDALRAGKRPLKFKKSKKIKKPSNIRKKKTQFKV